ncbi:RNA polymerase II transcription elongation factor SpEAF [Fusarium falciforme]|nr:RNA polymerase II transcription elongation factor SpEAF [Fusarium falciforme]KAJ4254683.1 RNA polymerase II transcription elongation factor SpEAF [Fusarium falciforme]
MTEVGPADLSRLLQSKRNECSSIVTSRKRKLRELFAVATQSEGLPHPVLTNPDAPTTTPAEWQFLQANDIFQGKTLNEVNIPPRPTISLETLKKSLAKSVFIAKEPAQPHSVEVVNKQELVKTKDEGKSNGALPPTKADDGHLQQKPSTPRPLMQTPKTASVPQEPSQASQVAPPITNGVEKSIPTNGSAPAPPNAIAKPTPTVASSSPAPDTAPVPRQPQVTFQPGTKGDGAQNGTSALGKPAQGTGVTTAGPGPTALSIKPPTDAVRTSDAMSSPGSTAQSATTPAVHDASTDTSPEHEGPSFSEPVEDKKTGDDGDERDAETNRAARVASPEDLQNRVLNAPPDSAEAQLLQESIRSNAAAEAAAAAAAAVTTVAPKPSPTPAAAPAEEDSTMAGTDDVASPPASVPAPKTIEQTETEDVQPASDAKVVSESVPSADVPISKEIPDSQEEEPEQMDVDVPEPNASAESQSEAAGLPEKVNPSDAPSTPTPVAAEIKPKDTPPKTERAVTRVSSGAMRPKSVSEIVGETPRQTPTLEPVATTKSVENQLTPLTSTPKSPSLRHRHLSVHRRQRSRSQPSTVVFGKQPKRVEEKAMVPSQRDTIQPTEDYYTPLFVQGFAGSSSWMQPIEKILYTANKTVTTPDANLAIQDHQACKVLRRVYHLQQHDKWSLRQPKRCPEPTRPPTHWDVMLQEMKWMRTDFREERKWKRAIAKNLAYACAEWHGATPEERKYLQVPAVIPPKPQQSTDVSMGDAAGETVGDAENQPTPDLVSSGDVESPENLDELLEVFPETVAPSAIFTLQEDDVIFGLRRTAAADQLLEELPMYGTPLQVPKFDLTGPEWDPDAHWRRPALPLSKYVEGHMKLVVDGPPRKRSRFDYQNEDSEDEGETAFVSNDPSPSLPLPAETNEVALFNPDMKHIRDRLHAGHQFRPPSEHPMPLQSFYEGRSPSQWTLAEDDELRSLVREYSYNWSLISSLLTPKSLFTSGAERRTPWECFERWINLEGLPSDMQKTQYFKAYNSRIEAAQRVIMQQNQIAAQQASASGGAVTPVRRRPSTPMRVERRRNQKHLTMIDAMRKLAKKRETTIQKQQHTASQNAANKKTNDPMSQRPTKTPRDYSLLRWERDQALAEKMAQYASRQEAQRRAALQARAQGQAAQMAGTPGVAQAAQTSAQVAAAAAAAVATAANGMNGAGRVNVPNQLAAAAAMAAGQNRTRMPMQSPANGMGGVPSHMAGGLVPPNQMTGVQQAQMQALQGQHGRMPMPNPQPDVNLMMRAQRISEQQRAAVQMQQGGPGTPGQGTAGSQQSPPPNMRNGVNGINATAMSQQNFINNAQAMMASFNASNHNGAAPQANGLHMPSGPAGSLAPRPQPQLPASIANQLAQLEGQFRAKNPNITPEQARQLATEHLTRAMMAQRQSAMNAAAGAANGQGGLAGSIAATTSPHQYAALLRQQQQQQASQAAGSPGQQHQQAHQQQAQHQAQQHQAQAQPQQKQTQPQSQAQQQAQQAQPQKPQQPQSQQQPTPQQQQQQQHQRQASGSATPSAGK